MDRIMEDLVPENEILNSEHVRNLFFGNYMEPDSDIKTYDQVYTYLFKKKSTENYFLFIQNIDSFLKTLYMFLKQKFACFLNRNKTAFYRKSE